MSILNFENITDECYAATTIATGRLVSIHLERECEGRVCVLTRHSGSSEWTVNRNIHTSANCHVELDIIVVPQELRIESHKSKPIRGSVMFNGNNGDDSADVDSIAELREELIRQASINEEQQRQIDNNTAMNEQQETDIRDNTMLAEPEQVDNLFK